MRTASLLAGLGLLAGVAVAETRDEEFTVGDQLVRIEAGEGMEVMWIGPGGSEGTQVLSGPDIEILAELTDDEALQMLGLRALVAVVPGTHSCENLGDPRAYYVVTLGEAPAADGPLTTCVDLTVSTTPGQIVLEEDPMGDGEYWTWSASGGFAGG